MADTTITDTDTDSSTTDTAATDTAATDFYGRSVAGTDEGEQQLRPRS